MMFKQLPFHLRKCGHAIKTPFLASITPVKKFSSANHEDELAGPDYS